MNYDCNHEKSHIRRHKLKDRAMIDAVRRNQAHQLFYEWFSENPAIKKCTILLAYASFGSELNLDEVISLALSRNMLVFLPRVCDKEMDFYRIEDLTHFALSDKNIREPLPGSDLFEAASYEDCPESICFLMPGVAFDLHNNRLGYGGGYYDRYLQKYSFLQDRTIAVGFAEQMTESVPRGEYDILPREIRLF